MREQTGGERQRILRRFEQRHRRQATQEDLAVGAGPESWIAQDNHAAIIEITNQTTDPLLQRQDGLR